MPEVWREYGIVYINTAHRSQDHSFIQSDSYSVSYSYSVLYISESVSHLSVKIIHLLVSINTLIQSVSYRANSYLTTQTLYDLIHSYLIQQPTVNSQSDIVVKYTGLSNIRIHYSKPLSDEKAKRENYRHAWTSHTPRCAPTIRKINLPE